MSLGSLRFRTKCSSTSTTGGSTDMRHGRNLKREQASRAAGFFPALKGDQRNALTQGVGMASAIWNHPANNGRRLRAVLQFLDWQVSKRAFRRPRVIDFHGMRLKCYPDSISTSAALYFNGLSDY